MNLKSSTLIALAIIFGVLNSFICYYVFKGSEDVNNIVSTITGILITLSFIEFGIGSIKDNKKLEAREFKLAANTYGITGFIDYKLYIKTNFKKKENTKGTDAKLLLIILFAFALIIVVTSLLMRHTNYYLGLLSSLAGTLIIAALMIRNNKNTIQAETLDNNFNLVNVTNKEFIKELYDKAALTVLSDPDIRVLNTIYYYLKNNNLLKNEDKINLYIFQGNLVKEEFNNCTIDSDIRFMCFYPSDLNINNENLNTFLEIRKILLINNLNALIDSKRQ